MGLLAFKQVGEFVKQQILEFETHLAAATTKNQITESNSLLIPQLTRMEPTLVQFSIVQFIATRRSYICPLEKVAKGGCMFF